MKTSHQLARELLAGPDLPIHHFDPSRAGLNEERDTSLSEPTVFVESYEKNKPRFITICGEIDPEGEAMSNSESKLRNAARDLVNCSVPFANPNSGQQKRLVDEEFVDAIKKCLSGEDGK